MEKMKNKNIWKKWYMIVLYIIMGLLVIGAIFTEDEVREVGVSDCECNDIKYKLNICNTNSKNMIDAWDNYMLAFEDYCELDYTNTICIALIN